MSPLDYVIFIALVGLFIWGVETYYWEWYIWRDMKVWRAKHEAKKLLKAQQQSNPVPPTDRLP
jgi:hypothetical protein